MLTPKPTKFPTAIAASRHPFDMALTKLYNTARKQEGLRTRLRTLHGLPPKTPKFRLPLPGAIRPVVTS